MGSRDRIRIKLEFPIVCDDNELEKGNIKLESRGEIFYGEIIRNDQNWIFADTIDIKLETEIDISRYNKGHCRFSDDDISKEDFKEEKWGGYDLPFSDIKNITELLEKAMREAYICPTEFSELYRDNDIIFIENINSRISPLFWCFEMVSEKRDLPLAEKKFWTIQIAICFQGEREEDVDPNTEDGCWGLCLAGFAGRTKYRGICMLFFEPLREVSWSKDPKMYKKLLQHNISRILAHETGHLMNLPHVKGDYIMNSEPLLSGGDKYSDKSINRLRSQKYPVNVFYSGF